MERRNARMGRICEESYGSNDENAIRIGRREREREIKIESNCLFHGSVYPVDFPVTVV